jgi:integrative and conjugative element protein (TIGR02256 family)
MQYPIGDSGQEIVLSDEVLQWFRRHAQKGFWQPEAGGQLFARLTEARIDVELATGPYSSDIRRRTQFVPDKAKAQWDIDRLHKLGLHFIGHWHTHPELAPKPSSMDLSSIGDNVRLSKHHLNGFVLVIVGTGTFPDGLYLGIHDGSEVYELAARQTAKANQRHTRKVRLI